MIARVKTPSRAAENFKVHPFTSEAVCPYPSAGGEGEEANTISCLLV
jgi:hypothetical protein